MAKWTKALGEGYVLSKSQVKQDLSIVVNDYFNKRAIQKEINEER